MGIFPAGAGMGSRTQTSITPGLKHRFTRKPATSSALWKGQHGPARSGQAAPSQVRAPPAPSATRATAVTDYSSDNTLGRVCLLQGSSEWSWFIFFFSLEVH